MRRLLLPLLAVLALTACESSNKYGECVGLNDKKDPHLEYKFSVRNIVVSCIFVETIFVPAVTILTELECPVAGDQRCQ